MNKLMIALGGYDESHDKLDLITTEVDLRVVREAKIIGTGVGFTTSDLARNLELFRRINNEKTPEKCDQLSGVIS